MMYLEAFNPALNMKCLQTDANIKSSHTININIIVPKKEKKNLQNEIKYGEKRERGKKFITITLRLQMMKYKEGYYMNANEKR